MEPRVHGTIITAEIEPGDAATVTARLDSYQRDNQSVQMLSRPTTITFFCPNYEPKVLKAGDQVWMQFECYADWEDLSESPSREQLIQPLREAQSSIEYSLTGEIFHLAEPNETRDIYIDAIVPILMTLGLPANSREPRLVRDGQIMRLSKGTLYGDIEM